MSVSLFDFDPANNAWVNVGGARAGAEGRHVSPDVYYDAAKQKLHSVQTKTEEWFGESEQKTIDLAELARNARK